MTCIEARNRLTFSKGFTVLELLTVIAVIGVMTAIAIPTYQYFIRKSQTAEILLSYDDMRQRVQTLLAQGLVNDCSELASQLTVSLGHEYANLSLGFDAVNGQTGQGYSPVFLVCANATQQGALGMEIARAAHDEFVLTNTVSPLAVLTDSLVSFSVPIGDGTAACMTPVQQATSTSGCGSAPAQSQPQSQPQTTQQTAPAAAAGPPVPAGMKAGTTPLAPWVPANAAPRQIGSAGGSQSLNVNMRGYANFLRASSPDPSAPVQIVGIRVEGATASMPQADGFASVTFDAPGTGRARVWLTLDNGHGQNEIEAYITR